MAAALREAWEELGLEPATVETIAALDPYRTITGFSVTPIIGVIPSDSDDWIVFERSGGKDHYLVLINRLIEGKDYRFHTAWFPQYRGADLIFWSDGRARNWKDTTADNQRIRDSVFVPPAGLVVIRQRP